VVEALVFQMKLLIKKINNPIIIGGLLILTLRFLTWHRHLNTPAIFGDDWIWYVKLPLEGGLHCPEISPRFFLNCIPALQNIFFGLNFSAHRIVVVLISLFTVIGLYFLLCQLFPRYHLLNIGVSLLWLYYPLDNYRQISVMATYMNLGYLFLILSFAALTIFIRKKKWFVWIIALLMFIISLGLYEAVIGIMTFGSVVYFALSWRMEKKFKIAFAVPVIISVSFILSRILYQLSDIGTKYGHPTNHLAIDAFEITRRTYLGFRFLMHWAWTHPLISLFPDWLTQGGHDNLNATLIIFATLIIILIGVLILSKFGPWIKMSENIDKFFQHSHVMPTKDVIIISLIGVMIMLFGYFPSILAIFPSSRFEVSRIFTLPSLGVCLMIGLFLWWISQWISYSNRYKYRKQVMSLTFLALVMPFVLFGSIIKFKIEEQFHRAWLVQKTIWSQFFELVPDFADGTYVVLLMPKYDSMMDVPPLQAGYDSFEYALSSLYGNRHIIGAFREASLADLVFTKEGLIVDPINYPVIMPYEKVLIFEFDSVENRLSRVVSIPLGISTEITDEIQLCEDCIRTNSAQGVTLRRLVY
jgi:hypothetical protein